ncbi:MAG: hypothetical protein HC915_13685 [Anaerolineae bacterium]|nr:hypothetical protein [Anaerolineae bacterium]
MLAEDDDSGGAFNALVSSLTLAAGQTVTLEVSSFAGQSGGDYLLVIVPEALESADPIEGGALAVGEAVEGELRAAGQLAEYSLSLDEAATLTLTVEGLAVPTLDVLDADGALVARGAVKLEALKLDPGTYTVRVYDRLNRTGTFTLTITSAE